MNATIETTETTETTTTETNDVVILESMAPELVPSIPVGTTEDIAPTTTTTTTTTTSPASRINALTYEKTTGAPALGTTDGTAIIDGQQLARALKLVKGFVAGKTTLPVLNNVLLASTGAGEYLQLEATNLETAIRVTLPGLVDDGFSITVPYKLFAETSPANGDVLMTIDGRTRTIATESGKTRTNYKGIDSAEWPIVPSASTATLVCVMPRALVLQVIKDVAMCASGDDSRPQLAGIYLKVGDDGSLTFAAADGFRLGRLFGHVSENSPAPVPGGYIIPASSFALLAVVDSDNVAMYIQPNGVGLHFVGHSVEVITRRVDGNYVDINRVIPTDWASRLVLHSDDLLAACKSLKPFARDSANIMRLQYTDGAFVCSANAAEVGDRAVIVPNLEHDGESEWQCALNLTFVAELVGAHKGETCALEAKTYQSPIVFKYGEDLLYVIMPMYLPNR